MNRTCGEKILTMRSKNGPAVVTMQPRDRARSSAVVLPMHSVSGASSRVASFPDRATADSKLHGVSVLRAGAGALSAGVRMTLVALFALLGWPHPTRDNDPGPSAARPSHWEVISLISRLHLLPSSHAKAAAAEIGPEEEVFARAA